MLGSSVTPLADDVLLSSALSPTHAQASSLSRTETAEWLPPSLHRSYLFSLAIISLALGMCCFILAAYSHLHDGLSNTGSNSVSKFYQRFLPTLVAVLYTLLWRPVVVDIIRTEPWAFLSFLTGSKARDSLLKTDKMWWSHVADAFRTKTRPGGVRWALFISVIAGMVASIVVNALSAGLFDTLSLLVTSERQFMGILPLTSEAQPWRIGDATYLRAVTNLLFNVSTSAWTTDEFIVAPFWPSDLDQAPLAASLARSPQLWVGTRDVLIAQFQCQPFTTISSYYDSTNFSYPYLQTEDGCAVLNGLSRKYDGRCSDGIWGQINVREPSAMIRT